MYFVQFSVLFQTLTHLIEFAQLPEWTWLLKPTISLPQISALHLFSNIFVKDACGTECQTRLNTQKTGSSINAFIDFILLFLFALHSAVNHRQGSSWYKRHKHILPFDFSYKHGQYFSSCGVFANLSMSSSSLRGLILLLFCKCLCPNPQHTSIQLVLTERIHHDSLSKQ